jgi:hypothetical protein
MGCAANIVASINSVIFSFFLYLFMLKSLTFLTYGVDLGTVGLKGVIGLKVVSKLGT